MSNNLVRSFLAVELSTLVVNYGNIFRTYCYSECYRTIYVKFRQLYKQLLLLLDDTSSAALLLLLLLLSDVAVDETMKKD